MSGNNEEVLRKVSKEEAVFKAAEASDALFGLVINDQAAIHAADLQPGDFYLRKRQQMWAAMQELAMEDIALNSISIADAMDEDWADVGSISRELMRCARRSPARHDVAFYAAKIREAAARRRLRALAEKLAGKAFDPECLPGESSARIATDLLAGTYTSREAIRAAELSDEIAELIAQWAADPLAAGEIRGRASGLAGLDRYTGGWPDGLSVIASHTHVGKTGIGLCSAEERAAGESGVLYLTFEQSARIMQLRQACSMAGINVRKAQRGVLEAAERARLRDALARLSAMNWLWYDGGSELYAISSQIHKCRARDGVDLIIVDNLDYVQTGDDTDYARVSAACKALNAIGRRLGIAIVALHQVNRSAPARPTLSTLRDSGKVEETSNIVVLLEENEMDGGNARAVSQRDHQGQAVSIVKAHVDKNKSDGVLGTAPLAKLLKTGRFYDAKI